MRRRDFLGATVASAALGFRSLRAFGSTQTVSPAWREPGSDAELFSLDELTPSGQQYKAVVPDTLDLAERGRLLVRGLINFLDPSRSYEPYQLAFFNANPPYMSHYGTVGNNWGKITEGILMGRHMSGSTENLAEETAMLKGILPLVGTNGEFQVDDSHSIWGSFIKNEDIRPMDTSRVYMSFMVQNQLRPSARLMHLITRMADSVCTKARTREDYAYLLDVPPDTADSDIGVLGSWQVIFVHGTALRGLARMYDLTGEQKYLDLGAKFRNLLMKPKYWTPEAAPKAMAAGEHAQFQGHHHSQTAALMGLLWYAAVTNDARTKEFVRDGYQYLRDFGIARIGMFGEMCTTGDMTWLAIKLSDLGVGDYWEDVDQYVRNQLTEQQMTSAAKMQAVVASMPALTTMQYPEYAGVGATTQEVIERNVGAYLSDASNPTLVRPQTLRWTICCSGNCPPALYAAWEAIVRYDGGVAQVNLLLNRASPWVDIASYLPHEGKVVIHNKTAQRVLVRIPRWAEKEKVIAQVNNRLCAAYWFGRYLCVEGLRAGDDVSIEFPMVESQETYTLKWRAQDMWPESTNPGNAWKPNDPPDRFTFHLRGNTVVDVTPRAQGPGYPLYQRDACKKTTAPMHEMTRYVAPVVVKL